MGFEFGSVTRRPEDPEQWEGQHSMWSTFTRSTFTATPDAVLARVIKQVRVDKKVLEGKG